MSKINEALEYTKEFFAALEAMVDKGMRVGPKCVDCRTPGAEWKKPRRMKPGELPQLKF